MSLNRWFRDRDGVWAHWHDPDGTETYSVDWSRRLGKTSAGAQITISTVSWEANDGLSIVTESNDTTSTDIQITKTGEATATVTTSTGDTVVETFRFKERDR